MNKETNKMLDRQQIKENQKQCQMQNDKQDVLRFNAITFIVRNFKLIEEVWPLGQIHFNDSLITRAFGEWIEFNTLNTIVSVSDFREHNINLKNKFGVDLNLVIDPQKLEPSLDSNNN
jgi:hypothetical protein